MRVGNAVRGRLLRIEAVVQRPVRNPGLAKGLLKRTEGGLRTSPTRDRIMTGRFRPGPSTQAWKKDHIEVGCRRTCSRHPTGVDAVDNELAAPCEEDEREQRN